MRYEARQVLLYRVLRQGQAGQVGEARGKAGPTVQGVEAGQAWPGRGSTRQGRSCCTGWQGRAELDVVQQAARRCQGSLGELFEAAGRSWSSFRS